MVTGFRLSVNTGDQKGLEISIPDAGAVHRQSISTIWSNPFLLTKIQVSHRDCPFCFPWDDYRDMREQSGFKVKLVKAPDFYMVAN